MFQKALNLAKVERYMFFKEALFRSCKIFLQSVVAIRFNVWEQHVNCEGNIMSFSSSSVSFSYIVVSVFIKIFPHSVTSMSESDSSVLSKVSAFDSILN